MKNMISTKGRYALRAMADLAEHADKGFIPLRDVAEGQGISESYLENIMANLSKAKLVISKRGMNGGGFKLAAAPDKITVADIMIAAGEELAPVMCLKKDIENCQRHNNCKTLHIWQEYYDVILNYLKSVTLADVCKEDTAGEVAEVAAPVHNNTNDLTH